MLNLVATLGTATVLWATFRRFLPGHWASAASAAAVVGLNLVGVAFTGMEHSLQALLAVALGRGVVLTCAERRMPGWLPVVMVLGPLVRYENAALSVAAAVVLASSRLWRPAVLATAGWVTGVAAFSLFLVRLGLDPLPSSVLAKSAYTHQPLGTAVASQTVDACSVARRRLALHAQADAHAGERERDLPGAGSTGRAGHGDLPHPCCLFARVVATSATPRS